MWNMEYKTIKLPIEVAFLKKRFLFLNFFDFLIMKYFTYSKEYLKYLLMFIF